MSVANNSAELEKMIMDQVQKAMQATQVKIKADMLKETQAFYSQGSPTLYTRTGQLGSSPRTTPVVMGGNSASFEAYLQLGSYHVPNEAFTSRGWASYFSPLEVMTAAEAGTAHIKGKSGFWERSLQHMEKDVNTVFGRYFK